MSTAQAVKVVLVEDDLVDVKAIQRAFATLHITNPLYIAHDGLEAFELLRGSATRQPLEKPYIILLDLNMPRMNGIEFLRALRNDAQHRETVVFVLTTSQSPQDIHDVYQWNIAGYLVKSSERSRFLDTIAMLRHYWQVVELP